jgi:WhiB family redox-sensing transcriptional regulator
MPLAPTRHAPPTLLEATAALLRQGPDRWNPAWAEDAACRGVDPDLFFPERGGAVDAALSTCAGCPVRAECLADALLRGERHGIWGGTSERTRRVLRRQLLPATRTAAA